MQQNFPDCIKNDKDLIHYERHLRSMDSIRNESNDSMVSAVERHKNFIGKMVKVESLVGNRLMCKIGVLVEVSSHHIIIKIPKTSMTVMIPMDTVKYVTIIHGCMG